MKQIIILCKGDATILIEVILLKSLWVLSRQLLETATVFH